MGDRYIDATANNSYRVHADVESPSSFERVVSPEHDAIRREASIHQRAAPGTFVAFPVVVGYLDRPATDLDRIVGDFSLLYILHQDPLQGIAEERVSRNDSRDDRSVAARYRIRLLTQLDADPAAAVECIFRYDGAPCGLFQGHGMIEQ